MKRLLTAAFAVSLASAAFAGNSDRYNDLRFDSAVGHVGKNAASQPVKSTTQVTYSTNGAKKPRYADANPYGIGPNNDSR